MKNFICLPVMLFVFVLKGSGQIEGNVFDSSGKPVADAIIIAIDSVKNISDTVKSDKLGYYAYKKLKKGKYKIVAKLVGFQNAIYENIIVENETSNSNPGGNDISNAIWLEIVLKRSNPSK